jgi:hypothetical protein
MPGSLRAACSLRVCGAALPARARAAAAPPLPLPPCRRAARMRAAAASGAAGGAAPHVPPELIALAHELADTAGEITRKVRTRARAADANVAQTLARMRSR